MENIYCKEGQRLTLTLIEGRPTLLRPDGTAVKTGEWFTVIYQDKVVRSFQWK